MDGSRATAAIYRRQDPSGFGQQDGQADIRKLLIVGAMSRIRWIARKGVLPDNAMLKSGELFDRTAGALVPGA